MKITSARTASNGDCRVILSGNAASLKRAGLSKEQISAVQNAAVNDTNLVYFPSLSPHLVVNVPESKKGNAAFEVCRKLGAEACELLNTQNQSAVYIENFSKQKQASVNFSEGLALANYQFLRYKTEKTRVNALKQIKLDAAQVGAAEVKQLLIGVEATMHSRDLVNEPLSFLTAPQLSKEIQKLGRTAGFSVKVFGKKKLEELGMGGLLSVNLGSVDPPTFTIMEWKPKKAKNSKPVVLVGKGVVYDTGGLSLKPTKNSMDFMKSDMGGAAAVVGAMYAVSKAKIPIHLIALIPATDNRPGGNAYVPGDVIEMYSGKTVEVLNTDAEGRMCLADALHWAKQYKPELVIDLATLTGAAARAVGPHGLVAMGVDSEAAMKKLKEAGEAVYERIVEFPMWEEYGDEIVSDIADIKNVGSTPNAGMVTAGKFLEHFTSYPWIHIDIAGSAFIHSNSGYMTKNGTGAGTRILFEFLKNYAK
ncbi:MAG: leucyl aminopeptidase [Limisphaerales bacterium]|jgi:leucyl aminopeptidase